jgi:prepilin-type processing-associated H-X9-DG protein
MAKKTTTTKSKRRANVKKLQTRQELTADQAKSVQGGLYPGGVQVVMADGSVRLTDITDGTSNTLKQKK